jgi:hypothetical protein
LAGGGRGPCPPMHILSITSTTWPSTPAFPCRTQMDIQNISFEVDAIKGQYTQNLMRQVRGCCSTAGGTGGTVAHFGLRYESLRRSSTGHSQRCRRCTAVPCSLWAVYPAPCLPASCLCAWRCRGGWRRRRTPTPATWKTCSGSCSKCAARQGPPPETVRSYGGSPAQRSCPACC